MLFRRIHGTKLQCLGDFRTCRRTMCFTNNFLNELEIAANAPLFAKGADSTFMNKVHLALNPPEEKADGKGEKTGDQ